MEWTSRKLRLIAAALAGDPSYLQYVRHINFLELAEIYSDKEDLVAVAVCIETIRNFSTAQSELPTSEELFLEAVKDCIRKNELLEINTKKVEVTVSVIYKTKESMKDKSSVDVITNYLEKFAYAFYFKERLISSAQQCGSVTAAKMSVEKILSEMGEVSISRAPDESLMGKSADWFNMLHQPKRHATGIAALDELLGSGFTRGEVYFFLAPTSGGKTLLSNEISIKQSLQGQHILYCPFEERLRVKVNPRDPNSPVASNLLFRALGPGAGISSEEIRQYNSPTEFPEALTNKIKGMKEMIDTKWHVAGFAGAGIEYQCWNGFEKYVRETYEKHPIDVLLVDPVWQIVSATGAMMGITDPKGLRYVGMDVAHKLVTLTEELGLITFVTHQLNATAGTSKSPKSVSVYDSSEVKTFPFEFPNVIIMTAANTKNQCWLVLKKGRNTGRKFVQVKIKVNGDMGCIEKDSDANKITGHVSELFRGESDEEVVSSMEDFVQSPPK